MNKKNSSLLVYLILGVAGVLAISFIASCGKTTVLPAASNIDLQVLNLSPDLQLVDLYIDNAKKNSTSFSYPNSSGYFAL
ncbi:MAG: hypothetical protein JWR67_621, partial [Mucilaginibacter sp.]|nr:hypothetical protein [Mucilaginibacter sp.]